MLIELKMAENEKDFTLLAELAHSIWREHYDGIVDMEQIDYMLETNQSPEAIAQQIEEGYHYSIVLVDTEPAGYLSYRFEENKDVFLNKFYVAAPYRGMGVGKYMLKMVENESARNGCKKIWLVVNKNNTNTITAYEKMGFLNKGPLKTDIGNGYIMDDYHLVKAITFASRISLMDA